MTGSNWVYKRFAPILLKVRGLPCRQQVFAAFTEECLTAPFTDQVFHFVVPALADAQTAFPFEPFLDALLSVGSRGSRARGGAPWLFYFVLTVGENYLGMNLSAELPCRQHGGWGRGRQCRAVSWPVQPPRWGSPGRVHWLKGCPELCPWGSAGHSSPC